MDLLSAQTTTAATELAPDRGRTSEVGALLREWRRRRGLTQLDLALLADTSTRHLSFVETGRARPGPALLARLADRLNVPDRHRDALYLAAGHAPASARPAPVPPHPHLLAGAVERLLTAHEPFPALAFDAEENVVSLNRPAALLARLLPEHLRRPPVNLMRASLHPDGLARHVVNLAEWREHLLGRLHRQMVRSGLPALRALHREVSDYPGPAGPAVPAPGGGDVLALLHLRALGTEVRLLSTVTTFGAGTDTDLCALSLETFHPADAHTAEAFRTTPEAPA
ncbi:helix-turn-helix domain-containing protein [Kitasatospora sp. NPDC057198]|uniref:helix-turn-helix domain-containing protein n=1 Tax=Kitasatospora sp. NPDC057198 TaxID=3346046 RepID=UPI00363DA918